MVLQRKFRKYDGPTWLVATIVPLHRVVFIGLVSREAALVGDYARGRLSHGLAFLVAARGNPFVSGRSGLAAIRLRFPPLGLWFPYLISQKPYHPSPRHPSDDPGRRHGVTTY